MKEIAEMYLPLSLHRSAPSSKNRQIMKQYQNFQNQLFDKKITTESVKIEYSRLNILTIENFSEQNITAYFNTLGILNHDF